jgi:hypothetical protein
MIGCAVYSSDVKKKKKKKKTCVGRLVRANSYSCRACVGRFVFTLNRLPSRIPAKISPTDPSAGRVRARPLRRIGQNTRLVVSGPISLPLNCPAGGQAIALVRGYMTARGHFGRRGTRWGSPAGYLDTTEAARAVGMRTSSRGSLKSNMRGYLSSSVYEHVQRYAPAPAPTISCTYQLNCTRSCPNDFYT